MSQTIRINGMSCDGCERTVQEAIQSVPGVDEVEVDHTTGTASVTGDGDSQEIHAAIEAAGYEIAG